MIWRKYQENLKNLRLAYKHGRITKQQFKTLRGQALSGNLEGARRGLLKLLKGSN